MDQLASRNIPQLDEGIISTAGKGAPIRREGQTEDHVCMPTRPEQSPALHIPELDCSIPTPGGQRALIWAQGERKEIVAVRLPGQRQALTFLMPDTHIASPAPCGPNFSCGADGHRPDRMHRFSESGIAYRCPTQPGILHLYP